VLFVGMIMLAYGYVVINNEKLNLCKSEDGIDVCILHYNSYIDPVMFFSLAVILISLVLFFISDSIFKKWLHFALIWFLLTIILIIFAPVSTGGLMNFGPTKESVSIWMAFLFIISSLILIAYQKYKLRKNN